ncbi:MAG: tetratricopeptide repeat protein [Chthoniobacterales bacterium]
MITAIEKHTTAATSDSKKAQEFQSKVFEAVKKRTPFYLSQGFTKKDLDELYRKGNDLFAEKEYAEARQVFQIMTAYDHTDKRAWMNVARVEEELQEYASAAIGYNRAAALLPKDPEPLIRLYHCYRALNKTEEVEKICQKICALVQNITGIKNIETYPIELFQAAIEKKPFHTLQTEIPITDDELDLLYEEACSLLAHEEFEKANQLFQAMIYLNHLDQRGWIGAANSFKLLEKYDLASDCYIRAEFFYLEPELGLEAADCQMMLGNYSNALKFFEKTASLAEQDPKHDEIKKQAQEKITELKNNSWNSAVFKKNHKRKVSSESLPSALFSVAQAMISISVDYLGSTADKEISFMRDAGKVRLWELLSSFKEVKELKNQVDNFMIVLESLK